MRDSRSNRQRDTRNPDCDEAGTIQVSGGRPVFLWFRILWNTWQQYNRHRGGETAAAMAYYGLFSLFPLVLFVVAALGFFLGSPELQEKAIAGIAARFPGSEELVIAVVRQVVRARGPTSLVAAASFLWAASGVFSALVVALDRAWGVEKGHPFWQEKLVALLLALAVGVLALVSMSASAAAQVLGRYGPALLPPELAARLAPLDVGGFIVAVITNIVAFAILYKWVPRASVPWKSALLSATMAGLTWEVAKGIFAWYLANYATRGFNLVYGPVGAVAALLLWTYVSAVIVLLGAEFSAAHASS